MRRKRKAAPPAEQLALIDGVDEGGSDLAEVDDYELQRSLHRMTLETSSNVYAQRRSTW